MPQSLSTNEFSVHTRAPVFAALPVVSLYALYFPRKESTILAVHDCHDFRATVPRTQNETQLTCCNVPRGMHSQMLRQVHLTMPTNRRVIPCNFHQNIMYGALGVERQIIPLPLGCSGRY